MSVLITGGAGFIGANFVLDWVAHSDEKIVNLDKLTYAGNLESLASLKNNPQHVFVHGDIGDVALLPKLLAEHKPRAVLNFAAESHVDRSIHGPGEFIETNIVGTFRLLESVRGYWHGLSAEAQTQFRFLHVSTDEVYGSLSDEGLFTEQTSYDPRSPYSASKASSDHFVRAYFHTYGLPVKLSNCSNNYGSFHFPEKLLPLMINNIIHSKPLPVYGKGDNVRDWLWVEDHARAIDVIFHKGRVGETYNIGGFNEWKNLDIVHLLCEIMDEKLGREKGESAKLITFVKDRAGHDKRYAIDATKLNKELGWEPSLQFKEGLDKTIDWYLSNSEWIANVTSGSYKQYYDQQYVNR